MAPVIKSNDTRNGRENPYFGIKQMVIACQYIGFSHIPVATSIHISCFNIFGHCNPKLIVYMLYSVSL